MILTVTLNAALDITYRVDQLAVHASHRVRDVAVRAGGKGVNVARVLHALGHEVLATGFAGGPTGEAVRADLGAAGVAEALVMVDGETRRTVTVVDTDATVFNEPGPLLAAGEWERFAEVYTSLLSGARAVVLSGSLPPGAPADAYAALAVRAGEAGVPVVLDADGDALRLGLAGQPTVVKPNAVELSGIALRGGLEGARQLRALGAAAVVVSRGREGLLAVSDDGVWQVAPPATVTGNPTGAGDAVVAALAAGLATGTPWPDTLARAVALGAAAVVAPLAGDIDLHAYRRFLPMARPEGNLEQCH